MGLPTARSFGKRHWAWLIFGSALALRVVFVACTTITPISDSKRYVDHARRLLDGLGFVTPEGLPTAYTPPGYPFFLAGVQAILGPDVRVAAYVQAVLGAACCVLTFWMCQRLFDLRTAVIAGPLLAVSPASIPYSGMLVSEVTTTLIPLALLFCLQLVRDRGALGVVLGW